MLHPKERQIRSALNQPVTPCKKNSGQRHVISDVKAQELVNWVLGESSHRHTSFREIPTVAPQYDLGNVGLMATRSALRWNRYERWVAKRNLMSTTDDQKATQSNLARCVFTWIRERSHNQSFTDEVWASGGANSRSIVTVLVKGNKEDIVRDRYHPDCLVRKCGKLPSWMFHGMIHNGRKALGTILKKKYGNMHSTGYNVHILSKFEVYYINDQARGHCPMFQYDNAPCHKSRMTNENLQHREIPTRNWPPYSPDLNLTENS